MRRLLTVIGLAAFLVLMGCGQKNEEILHPVIDLQAQVKLLKTTDAEVKSAFISQRDEFMAGKLEIETLQSENADKIAALSIEEEGISAADLDSRKIEIEAINKSSAELSEDLAGMNSEIDSFMNDQIDFSFDMNIHVYQRNSDAGYGAKVEIVEEALTIDIPNVDYDPTTSHLSFVLNTIEEGENISLVISTSKDAVSAADLSYESDVVFSVDGKIVNLGVSKMTKGIFIPEVKSEETVTDIEVEVKVVEPSVEGKPELEGKSEEKVEPSVEDESEEKSEEDKSEEDKSEEDKSEENKSEEEDI